MRARKRWTGYFGAAIAPDSNLNAASESEIIYIDTAFGRLPFQREGDFGAQSGFGFSVWGGGEYQHPLSERLRLRVGADVAQREYGGNDFDQLFVGAHAGPRWLAGPITEFSLLATANRQWLGGVPYADETGVRLEIGRQLLPLLWARGTAAYRERDHQTRDFLDGSVVDFTASFAWTVAPVMRVHATWGYERDHAASEHWRNNGRWVRVGTSLALPLGFHPGRQRPDAVDVLLREQRPGAPDAEGQEAAGPYPHVHHLGAQPRLHPARLQPAAGAHPRRATDQRAGAGLRPQPRRAALRAAVLTLLALPPGKLALETYWAIASWASHHDYFASYRINAEWLTATVSFQTLVAVFEDAETIGSDRLKESQVACGVEIGMGRMTAEDARKALSLATSPVPLETATAALRCLPGDSSASRRSPIPRNAAEYAAQRLCRASGTDAC